MSNVINIKEISNKKLKVKNGQDFTKKVYHISRKDNTTINSILFRDTFNTFSKKYGAENVMVRGLSNTGLFTFKTFDENTLRFEDFHEYFQNRVKDTSSYEYFYSIEIQVRSI